MNTPVHNLCIRCGSQRIVLKTSKEKMGNSVITTVETVCPDAECQKKVDQENKRQRDKTLALRLKGEQRALQRKAMRDAEMAAKRKKA